ncbi:MAG TPA: SAM-dependent chlorinase/fluorinase [Gemmatimonadales bacterium]|nr:SAM-dependent chlorinase/fluorinase [Gemmatimonadales bacterium]
MPIVTLLTDFGTSDSYVAEVKGRLLSEAPDASLVDITHALAPGDVHSAAYILGRVWRHFPKGTIHLAIVDPGVGTSRAAFALRAHGQLFVGPDNGIFTAVIREAAVEIVTLPIPVGGAPTFQGRDVFAPAAAALANGGALERLGPLFGGIPERFARREPHHEGKMLVGEVIYVDRFGTLVTNFTAENLPAYASIELEGTEVGRLRRTFGDVPTGGLVAYLGSGGEVEIAVRDGSAARRFGTGVGGKVRARLG